MKIHFIISFPPDCFFTALNLGANTLAATAAINARATVLGDNNIASNLLAATNKMANPRKLKIRALYFDFNIPKLLNN